MIHCRDDRLTSGRRSRVDVEIGDRIRSRREKLGLSQDQVADELGWFAAQVDDCENGLFCAPTRDLYLLADLLEVEMRYFCEGVVGKLTSIEPMPDALHPLLPKPHGDTAGSELLCIYARIKDARKQTLLLDLAESFARDS